MYNNIKNFIIEKINWVENKGNLQSLSSLSAFYLTMDRPLMTSVLLLATCTEHFHCGSDTILSVLQNCL